MISVVPGLELLFLKLLTQLLDLLAQLPKLLFDALVLVHQLLMHLLGTILIAEFLAAGNCRGGI
jgi:hypothetical protein